MMENSCANNLEIDQEIQEKKYGIEFDSEDDNGVEGATDYPYN